MQFENKNIKNLTLNSELEEGEVIDTYINKQDIINIIVYKI